MCSPGTGSQCTHGKTRLKRRAPAAVKINAAATPTAGPFDFNKDIPTNYIVPHAGGARPDIIRRYVFVDIDGSCCGCRSCIYLDGHRLSRLYHLLGSTV